MESIGVLGGSFNPPHQGHVRLAEKVGRFFSKVLVVPCGDRPDKEGLVESMHRLEMTRLAFNGLQPKVEVSKTYPGDIEVQNGTMIPSYYLLTRLMREHPSSIVKMIIGSDLVPTLPRWIQAKSLITDCYFFIVPRLGFEIPEEYRCRANFEVMPEDYEPSGESSTSVRDLVERGAEEETIMRETTKEVLEYIRRNGLYGGGRGGEEGGEGRREGGGGRGGEGEGEK